MRRTHQNIDVSDGAAVARIVASRRAQGLSKRELAERAGVTYRTIHDLECGRRPRVQEKTLLLIGEALEVSLPALIDGPPPAPETADDPADAHPGAETGASAPGETPASAAPARGPRSRRRPWTRPVAGSAAVMLLALVVLGVRAAPRATAVVVDGATVRGQLPAGGVPTWSRTFDVPVNFDRPAPWAESEWLVGLHVTHRKGGALVALDRATGRDRWRVGPDLDAMRALFGEGALAGNHFFARAGTAADLDGDGTSEFVVVFHHGLYAPAVVLVVEADGHVRARYAHYGHLVGAVAADLDGDGRDAVYLTGTSNVDAHEGATVIRLDADGMQGHVLESAALRPHVATDGAAVRLVLRNYPAPFMQQLESKMLVAHSPRVVSGADGRTGLTVRVGRSAQPDDPAQVIVHLDGDLHVLHTACHDRFRVVMEREWPAALRDGSGPADAGWRQEWVGRAVRFEQGLLVGNGAK